MHEEDLTDLAMIAACLHRLVSRARDSVGADVTHAVVETGTAAMTSLCALYGASATQVQDRVSELRALVRTQPTGAVH